MKKRIISLLLALALACGMAPAALASSGGIAKASTQNVEVDGSAVAFQMYALESAGGLTNYVKLRDVAHVLNSTPARFSVGYDGVISITTGESYTGNGSEMTTPFSGDRAYRPGPGSVKVNGADVTLDAIVLTDDSGGAYTYFKLRDLGAALGFKVDWTSERGVFIETGAPETSVPAAENDLTLADLQGSWLYVNPHGTAETELTISGDTFTYTHYVKESGPSNPAYYLYYTAPVTLKKEASDWKYSFLLGGEGDIPEYKVTGGNAELWEYGYIQAGDIVFPIREYGNGWFMAADRFEKIPSPKYHDQIKAIVDAAKEKTDAAQAAISKYPTYADYPGVPDFGAIFNVPWDDVWGDDRPDFLKGHYSYRRKDMGGDSNFGGTLDDLYALKEQYIAVLEECGYVETKLATLYGGYKGVSNYETYYVKDNIAVSVDDDFNSLYVYIQEIK